MPLGKMADLLNPKLFPASWTVNVDFRSVPNLSTVSDKTKIDLVIKRYASNANLIEAVASRFGVKVYFIWQPVPYYRYLGLDQLLSMFGEYTGEHMRSKYGYPIMNDFRKKISIVNFIWLADITKENSQLMYVDHCHYNPEMAQKVATCISRQIPKPACLSHASAQTGQHLW